jgi:transforming growth factor-beta-induced protein
LIDALLYLFIFAADIACNDPKFSTLCSLVVKADLVDKLDSNDLSSQKTVFAPTNDAFSRLSEVTLEALNDTDALVDVLLYHIAPVKIMSDDLECGLSTEMASTEMASFASTTTLCGKNGTFYQAGGGVTAGLPQIIAADIETCYGVIHVIDEVLLPG